MISRGLEEHMKFKGDYITVKIPLKIDGNINEKELEKRIESVYDSDTRGIVVLNERGEFLTFVSLEELGNNKGIIKNTKQPIFQGAYGIIITPFLGNGKVDYEELERQLEYTSQSSIKGLVVCGSTGEFTYLSLEEQKEIMRFSKKIIAGRKEFICGATSSSCHGTLELLKFIEELGADGALVAPPYYFPLCDSDVFDFYKTIASAPGNLPIIAYQIPQCTSGISMNVYQKLLELPRIKGIKNSSGNCLQIMQQIVLRNETRSDFSVLTGSDESIYALVNCGADGSFTAIGYLYPELISNVYKNLKNEIGLECQQTVVKLAALAGSIPYPLGYKMLGEASGRMKFGKYMQAVSEDRMNEYKLVKCRMQSVIREKNVK